MAKQRVVTLSGGASYTNIRASIPCHSIRVYQDGARDKTLVYQTVVDSFADDYTTKAGDAIQQVGHGSHGILGRPPFYSNASTPGNTAAGTGDSGGGDIVLKVKASDNSTPDVIVIEDESPSTNNQFVP